MIYDLSSGVIPLKKCEDSWFVLLIQQRADYWSFPKGHGENNETLLETAKRELKEETGLDVVQLISDEPIEEHYVFFRRETKVDKKVYYYLALVDGDLELQQEEIIAAKWVSLDKASDAVTFPEAKALCKQVIDILSNLKP